MNISELWRYPVKSMLGERRDTAVVTATGVAGDRAYAVIDRSDGKVASAKNPRKWRALLSCHAEFLEEPVAGGAAPSARITLPDGTVVTSDDPDEAEIVVPALARAFSALHAIPVRDCPFDESVAVRLGRAGVLVERGVIDPGAFASRNRDVSPAALLERLETRKPDEQVAVVHGDATLSNLIVGNDRSVAFIDCGHAGRADPYTDIALVIEGLAEQIGRASCRERVSTIV